MEITIQLDDQLLTEAEQLAALSSRSLSAIIEDALRDMLARQRGNAPRGILPPTVGDYERFNDSLGRCQAFPEFMPIFYANFLASSPQVKDKFANTDFDRQNRMLKGSLYMVMAASEGNDAAEKYLAQVAERHSGRDLDIEPELYDRWLDSLLFTVEEVDSQFTPTVGEAWRAVMREGIKYMVAAR